MGNVQCCASGRFPEGKPSKKLNSKNKNKKNILSNQSDKNNGKSKGDKSVHKAATVAEDKSKPAAPATANGLLAPPVDTGPSITGSPMNGTQQPTKEQTQQTSTVPTESAHQSIESIAAARERFFGQVL